MRADDQRRAEAGAGLGEAAGDDRAFAHHRVGDAATKRLGEQVQPAAEVVPVHVRAERGGAAAARQRLLQQAEVVDRHAAPAELGRQRQGEKARAAQLVEVLERKAGLAVVALGARGEARGEALRGVEQRALRVGQRSGMRQRIVGGAAGATGRCVDRAGRVV